MKIKSYFLNLFIALLYPIYKVVSSTNKLLAFSDACFLMGCIMLLLGVFKYLSNKGDFDITSYIFLNAFQKYKTSYEDYKKVQKESRKGVINSPLYVGLTLIIISFISANLYQ